jgi:hypothetical protein
VNADPPAYRYEINDLKDRCRDKLLDFFIALRREIEDEDLLTQCGHWMKKTEKRTTHRKGIPQEHQSPPANIYLHEADLWIERKMQERKMKYEIKKRCFGSVRYADGEYAAEQPQGLPAVIAELTRWVAQNLELTFQSEINVGSRLSEKHRLKRRITKCNTTRGEPSACAKEEANQSEWRQGGEAKEIFSSLQAASNNG